MDLQNFLDLTIEEIFSDRYSRYSKYVIQDRALPDARDGLKPVQRRILYSMVKEGNTFDKQFRKSAKTVGNVIGNYHPHGDTSVYDAMVRTSQTWKVNHQLVIMHGNNGSIDGDSAAAMRYTEAKLSKYSELIIQDYNENTVNMVPNFDDTELEPTVLPTRVPNLLINGGSGISTGYATDIPPHNATEVINAAIYLNNNHDASVTDLLQFVKGPDFPTGAIVQGKDELLKAYETGKGRIVVRSKYKIEKNSIIVTEIPFEVNKQNLVAKIDMIRLEKKVDGIVEVLDQSNREVLEIAINCKKGANIDAILNYLFKYTDLQKNYSFNMIAIDKRRPKLLSLKEILTSFIDHREEVVTRRSEFRLQKAKDKIHIVEGLIKAVDIMDRIIVIIRNSENKGDSKKNLVSEFEFSDDQAEAIVMMQLYRLSNTDIVNLVNTADELNKEIEMLSKILNDKVELKKTINDELVEVKEYFDDPRKTVIEDKIEKINIQERDLIKSENNVLSISKNGYVKRSTQRSYLASTQLSTVMDDDKIVANVRANTRDNLLVFFNDGTFINIFVHEIIESKYKEIGKHISTYAKINDGVTVVNVIVTNQFNDIDSVIAMSKQGYFIRVAIKDFDVKLKNKVGYQKLKAGDEVVSVSAVLKEDLGLFNNYKFITITNLDRYTALSAKDIELSSLRRVGRKIMTFRKNEEIISSIAVNKELLLISNKAGYVKLKVSDIMLSEKPLLLFENAKSSKHIVINTLADVENELLFVQEQDEHIVAVKDLSYTEVGSKIKTLNKFKHVVNVLPVLNIT